MVFFEKKVLLIDVYSLVFGAMDNCVIAIQINVNFTAVHCHTVHIYWQNVPEMCICTLPAHFSAYDLHLDIKQKMRLVVTWQAAFSTM
ncbi:hypothetical protein HYN43_006385 [Mucilaginibacter celer]|uniref:Uncharacterized protein n=1 Tax=Mucilaginibacter celer TaxID=2305508 RepID=A0A494VUE8_9SPHI|nr:hypothetical protein HYN43_006385 [Mucilaginibacter celer]